MACSPRGWCEVTIFFCASCNAYHENDRPPCPQVIGTFDFGVAAGMLKPVHDDIIVPMPCPDCGTSIIVYPEICGLLPEEVIGERRANHSWLVCELRVKLAKIAEIANKGIESGLLEWAGYKVLDITKKEAK